MRKCKTCCEGYEDEDVNADGVCRFCGEKDRFAAFAESCGMTRYPDPSGERYVYRLDGGCDGKKSECIDLMDELWNALVRAKGGDTGLLLAAKEADHA